MITLSPQTETKLQEIAAQTSQTVQELIESFIASYLLDQEIVKQADQSYVEYLESGVSVSLEVYK